MAGNDPSPVVSWCRPWVCPVKAHQVHASQHQLPLVEVRDEVSHCTYPGCSRSSVDDFSRR